MAEWLAIFFIKLKHKGGCKFSDVTTHHWAFFPAMIRESVIVLFSTGRSIQELKPEIDGK
jgi:hypothetical protein